MSKRPLIALVLSPLAAIVASCTAPVAGDNSTSSTGTPAAPLVGGETIVLEQGSPFSAQAFGTFNEPWALAFEPGTGNVFVTEKSGTMKFAQPGNGKMGFVESGLPTVAYGGQGGLGDVVFAPDYATSRTIYLSWAESGAGKTRRAAVGRGKLVCEDHDSCRIDGLTKIWQQSLDIESNGHFSHKLAFSPDGRYLFVASGDRMQKTPAQDLSNNLGSVVRLNLDGTPAAGNPYWQRGGVSRQVWSNGHRNILGLEFDPQGRLWALEHGPLGGDELNLVEPGNNYGWPQVSYGDNYDKTPIPDHNPNDGFVKPAIQWTPVIAPGGMQFYSGNMWPQWRGQALIANLGGLSISRVEVHGGSSATEHARYKFPKRLRDIKQAPDGALWVIEDREGGRLLRLTPAG